MVLKIKYILFILFLIFIIACEKEFHSNAVDCSYCYTDEPEYDDLVITLTINEENPSVPIKVYEGDLERGFEIYRDTVDTTKAWVNVELNKNYTVTAEYISGGKIITAVDNDKIRTKHETESCDEACWAIIGGYFDVRLKN